MKQKHSIKLSAEEHQQLLELIAAGTLLARILPHAHILLKADCGQGCESWSDVRIAQAFEVSPMTVGNVRRRYARQGLKAALYRAQPNRQYGCKLDGAQEAHLIALACSPAPEGWER